MSQSVTEARGNSQHGITMQFSKAMSMMADFCGTIGANFNGDVIHVRGRGWGGRGMYYASVE